jgi:hypothetical protein
MKKVITLALVAAFAVSLGVGCSSAPSSKPQPTTPPAGEKPKTP